MVIEVVNREQNQVQFDRAKLLTLPTTMAEAVSVVELIGALDMDSKTRTHFNTNRNTINNINSQLQAISKSGSSSSSGCYIATMVYGHYDHPQVLILRDFRDEILGKYYLGRGFIKLYYIISPQLVKLFNEHGPTNRFIRNILDNLIKIITK